MRRQNTSNIYSFPAESQSPKMFGLQRQPSGLQRQPSMSYSTKQIPHQIQPLTNLYPDMQNSLLSPRIPREGSFDSRLKNPLIDKISPRNIFHPNNGGYPQMNYQTNATPRHHYHAVHQSTSPVNRPRPLPQMVPRLNLDSMKRFPNAQPNGFVMHPPLRLNELERAVAYDMKFEAQIEKQNKMLSHLIGSIAKQEQIDSEMHRLHLQQHLKKLELDRAKYDLELERQQSDRIQRTHIQRIRSRNPSIAQQSKSDVKEVLNGLLLQNNSTLDLKNSLPFLLDKATPGQKSERLLNATNLLHSPGSIRSPSLTPSLTALINSNPKLSETLLHSPSMRSPFLSKKSIGRDDSPNLRNIEEVKSVISENSVRSFRLDGSEQNDDGEDVAEDSENEERKSRRKKSKKKKKSSEKKSKRSKKSKNVAFEDD